MTLSKQIIEVLNYLGEKVGIVIDWSAENVLPVAQQICERYIRYEIIMSIIWLLFDLAIIVMLIISMIKLFKFCIKAYKTPEYQRNYCVWAQITMIISGFVALIMGCCFIADIVENFEVLMKCILLPELHLLEVLKSLAQ